LTIRKKSQFAKVKSETNYSNRIYTVSEKTQSTQ